MQINTYIYGNSLYHHFDIRAKLIFSILISIALFFIDTWFILLSLALFFILLSLYSVGIKETWKGFLRLLPILIFLVLLSPLQDRSGEGAYFIKGFKLVTYDGLWTVFRVAMRFISISFAFMLLIETERSEKIISALEWFHPSYKVALMFSLVLRYIPYLGSLYEDIRLSMSLREKEGKRGYPIMPTITALTVAAIKMVPNTASALEERGFGLKSRKPSNKLGITFSSFTQIAISFILPIILLYLFA